MKTHSLLTTALLTALSVNATAATSPVQHDTPVTTRVEITAFGGYRAGGSFDDIQTTTSGGTTTTTATKHSIKDGSDLGLILNWEAEPNAFYEFAYSRQSTSFGPSGASPEDLTVEYFQAGGHVTFAEENARVTPYFVLTVGAAKFTPSMEGFEDETRFAAAVGGGAKFRITRHFAIRLDARAYATFFDNESDLFCSLPDAGCAIHLRGKTMLQTEGSLGFTVGF